MGEAQKADGPVKFVFAVPGHSRQYHLTTLLPYYGSKFCQRLADAWVQAVLFENANSATNYFKAIRKCFQWVAFKGLANSSSPEHEVYLSFRDSCSSPDEKTWKQVVSNMSSAILDPLDESFIRTNRHTSRNKTLESLRAGLERLSARMSLPFAPIEGRLEQRGLETTKCLATLSYEAGRLDIREMSTEQAYEAFLRRNRDMLSELRRLLWEELEHNWCLFLEGKRLLESCPVDVATIQDLLLATSQSAIARGEVTKALGLNREQEMSIALMLLRRRAEGAEFRMGYCWFPRGTEPVFPPRSEPPLSRVF